MVGKAVNRLIHLFHTVGPRNGSHGLVAT